MRNSLKLIGILAFIMLIAGQGFAQATTTGGTSPDKAGTAKGCKFVDKNNDGICDNYAAKGKGNCCGNFVDKNGDGICDNRGTVNQGTGCCGKGNMHRHGNGGANCPNQKNGKGGCGPCPQKAQPAPGQN